MAHYLYQIDDLPQPELTIVTFHPEYVVAIFQIKGGSAAGKNLLYLTNEQCSLPWVGYVCFENFNHHLVLVFSFHLVSYLARSMGA